jgi:hypothetical protein
LRAASSPRAIKAVLESLRDTDVRPLLPCIVTPTLVLHRRGDRAVRIEAGRDLAGAIRGARLVELDGDDHWLWAGNQRCVLEENTHLRAPPRKGPTTGRLGVSPNGGNWHYSDPFGISLGRAKSVCC